MGYADAIVIYSYATECSDVADAILARKELEAALERLVRHRESKDMREVWARLGKGVA